MPTTQDLILRKARFDDWPAIYHNVWSRPESFRYMLLETTGSEPEAQDRIRRTIEFQKDRHAYFVCLKSTGQAIGFTGIAPLEEGEWEETGICLGPDFCGRGYGWQVLQSLLALAKELGAKTFRYSSWEENAASRALAAKAGFTQYDSQPCTRPRDGQEYVLLKFRKAL